MTDVDWTLSDSVPPAPPAVPVVEQPAFTG